MFWRVFGITLGSIVVLAAINFAPMVSLKSPGMREYRANGMVAYAVPADEPEVELITARIARQGAAVRESLGAGAHAGPEEAVAVIVYPDRKVLHRKTIGLAGMLLPDWFIGDNTRRYVLITSPANPGPAHSRESIEKAAVHEYVHVMTDRRNRKLGYWLKEGIALYLAEQRPGVESLRRNADITWDEFANPGPLQFARVGGYDLAYDLVEYLADRYGWPLVIALTEPGATYLSVLGISERALFDEWIEALRATVAT